MGKDGYNMTHEGRLQDLDKVSADEIGIYEEAISSFRQYMQEMEQVRAFGGLHAVGPERHEARRIDNQLRGRAARQGDPGSSRFYLALDDELMRLFGGKQVEGLLSRLNIDESLPIESGLVGRLVEQSQERVEGSNFDVRKHLLEITTKGRFAAQAHLRAARPCFHQGRFERGPGRDAAFGYPAQGPSGL